MSALLLMTLLAAPAPAQNRAATAVRRPSAAAGAPVLQVAGTLSRRPSLSAGSLALPSPLSASAAVLTASEAEAAVAAPEASVLEQLHGLGDGAADAAGAEAESFLWTGRFDGAPAAASVVAGPAAAVASFSARAVAAAPAVSASVAAGLPPPLGIAAPMGSYETPVNFGAILLASMVLCFFIGAAAGGANGFLVMLAIALCWVGIGMWDSHTKALRNKPMPRKVTEAISARTAKSPSAVLKHLKSYADPDYSVRRQFLGEIGPILGEDPELVALLRDMARYETTPESVQAALAALGRVGGRTALAALDQLAAQKEAAPYAAAIQAVRSDVHERLLRPPEDVTSLLRAAEAPDAVLRARELLRRVVEWGPALPRLPLPERLRKEAAAAHAAELRRAIAESDEGAIAIVSARLRELLDRRDPK